ncbi:acyl-CoA dehydrogenase [Ferrovibrio sp.]|uniref:acyl-CoA dehydrogenase n=1 Tax=Ferrovibrio sp. TaxID=1917215 RepID=UPI000CC7DCFA|nr:acyl-CoA dehydrogenase [Ferrovibrio sp.]PJI39032.1 MAG: acyl-CoA dehydrogenase [Ferrovibrio sp.]
MEYVAPVKDMRFTLEHVAGLADLAQLPGLETAEAETVAAVLEEAARFAAGVLSPLNRGGDQHGAKAENGVVRTAPGFADAYKKFVAGGWNGMPFPEHLGGGAMPWAVTMAAQEMVQSANLSFSLCPLLTQGAIDAIIAHGTDEQRATYLPKMVSGEWTGSMNLTEPQAGSDVGALKSKAVPVGDGTYRISGSKIFITYGEHDMADNIIHLVLARLPDAPPGTKGISLFIVPKVLVNKDGSLGKRNDLRVVSLEHKLGIHASPTCVMSYGDNGDCVGYLLGAENQGMRCMFTMMNNARLSVGCQGLAIAERAYQQALDYAEQRKQGRHPGMNAEQHVSIIEHADVRRTLMLMRSLTEACRGLIYLNAAAIDRAHHLPDEAARKEAKALVELLTPLSKSWSTDIGCEVASMGVQIHGGMGFIEETGAAQHYRDARILPIYEGTNGIQAIDLVTRKLPQNGGETVKALFAQIAGIVAETAKAGEGFATIHANLDAALKSLAKASQWIGGQLAKNPEVALAGATPYLRAFATTVGGWLLAKQALAAKAEIAKGGTDPYFTAKIVSARLFADQVLTSVDGLCRSATEGSASLADVTPELLRA